MFNTTPLDLLCPLPLPSSLLSFFFPSLCHHFLTVWLSTHHMCATAPRAPRSHLKQAASTLMAGYPDASLLLLLRSNLLPLIPRRGRQLPWTTASAAAAAAAGGAGGGGGGGGAGGGGPHLVTGYHHPQMRYCCPTARCRMLRPSAPGCGLPQQAVRCMQIASVPGEGVSR